MRVDRRGDGSRETIYYRPGGIEVVVIHDREGNLLRRLKRLPGGREVVLIDNRRFYRDHRPRSLFEIRVDLPPPVIRIPRERYIVETTYASHDDIYDAFSAPPVEELDRRYSLEEVRRSHSLRERMRRVDIDTINFEFGSWRSSATSIRSWSASQPPSAA